jgi:streptomycin 6-kinase
VIEVPLSFRLVPRWWSEGQDWLDALPGLVAEQLKVWQLFVDGAVRHGSNALVVPVRRNTEPLVLKLTPADDRFRAELAALEFWAGRGTVLVLDSNVDQGVLLLERLNADRSAAVLPLPEAVPIVARMMRRLAVPAPAAVTSTGAVCADRGPQLRDEWERLARPFPEALLTLATDAADWLSCTDSELAVNADLHFDQVLPGNRERWLCVDPLLLRGDIEYDLARILWSRLDEMADDAEIRGHFQAAVAAAGLNGDRAEQWVIFRTVDYWLWGLSHRLTEDPQRCKRLAAAIYRSRFKE